MSKDIDFSQPLSEDDIAYVNDRPWLLQDARMRGEDIITEEDFFLDDDDLETDTDPETGNGPEGSDEETDESDDGSEDGDDTGSEETGGDASDDASDDESEDGEGDEDEVAPYAEWEYPALKEEAKSRNLSAAGSKEQLIKRLEEDDASAPE